MLESVDLEASGKILRIELVAGQSSSLEWTKTMALIPRSMAARILLDGERLIMPWHICGESERGIFMSFLRSGSREKMFSS